MTTDTLYTQVGSAGIRSPNHLKQWLSASGRRYLLMPMDELVDALPWPEGIETLMGLIECFRQYRCARVVESRPCERCAARRDAVKSCTWCGGFGVYNRLGTDMLEPDELKAVVEFLVTQIRTTEPTWRP